MDSKTHTSYAVYKHGQHNSALGSLQVDLCTKKTSPRSCWTLVAPLPPAPREIVPRGFRGGWEPWQSQALLLGMLCSNWSSTSLSSWNPGLSWAGTCSSVCKVALVPFFQFHSHHHQQQPAMDKQHRAIVITEGQPDMMCYYLYFSCTVLQIKLRISQNFTLKYYLVCC